jgi:hypothetical protein
MTNILTAAALSALSFTYQPDVRTAYLSRGRISEDRPIQSNLLRFDVYLDDYGGIGIWHWHYHSLTPRQREKRDRQFAESDWGVFYNYNLELAEGWTLKNEVMMRWFTFLFYHAPYKDTSDASCTEVYLEQALENPYVTPLFRMRRCFLGSKYFYARVGFRRKFAAEWFPALEGLTVTPAFYVDFGDDNQRARYGTRPHGDAWDEGVMSVLGELNVSYPLSEYVSVFATLQQMGVVNKDARDAISGKAHRDYTVFTIGAKCRF